MKELRGTGVAMITPFTQEGQVDYDAYPKLIEYYLSSGIDYLVILGTTAETATLTTQEKKKITRTVVSLVQGRVPLVYGFGGNNTMALLEEIKHTDFSGYSALLSVCPYYNKPNQKGIYLHFSALAKASPLPLLLYNVPSRTGATIANETTIALAKAHRNIIGIKDATGSIEKGKELLSALPSEFLILSGDDGTALALTLAGGSGVISVTAGGCPKTFSTLIAHGLKGEEHEGSRLQKQLDPIIDLMFLEGNPTGLKAWLQSAGLIANALRLPLVPASEELHKTIVKQTQGIE